MGVQTSSREPGITVSKRMETGMAVLFTLFDNFAETRMQSGRILLSLIQQYVSMSQVIRIEGPQGMQLTEINTQMQRDNEGFNDISAGEFDLVVDETIETASSRMLIAQILTDYAHNNPNAIPPDLILEYSNIPYTAKKKVQQTFETQQQQQQMNIEEDRKIKLLEIQAKVDIANSSATLQRDISQINAEQQKVISEAQNQQKMAEAEMKNEQ